MSEIINGISSDAFLGNLEVLRSETVHVSPERKLKINVNDLSLVFSFSTDSSVKETKISTSVDNKTLNLNLINFKNPLGEGLLAPAEVGTLNRRKLYLSFFVWTPNHDAGLRIINYVLYIGENANGQ